MLPAGDLPQPMIGLVVTALVMPLLSRAWDFQSAVALHVLMGVALALVVTPSLAFMAEATSAAGVESFGVSHGVYNFAWGLRRSAGRRSAVSCSSSSDLRASRCCGCHECLRQRSCWPGSPRNDRRRRGGRGRAGGLQRCQVDVGRLPAPVASARYFTITQPYIWNSAKWGRKVQMTRYLPGVLKV